MIRSLLLLALLFLGSGYGLATLPANETLFRVLNEGAAGLPASLWTTLTNLGATSVAVALLVAVTPWTMRPLWLAALAAFPTTLVVHGLKKAVAAPRPAAVLDPHQIVWFDLLPKSGAFPSGHTATAVVLGGALLCGLVVRRDRFASRQRTLPPARIWLVGAGVVFLVSAIAFSRIAVGAHWPSDVIGGLGAGLFGLTVAAFLIRRFPEPSPQTTRFLLVGGLATAAYAPFDHAIYPSGAALVWVVALAAWVGAIRRLGGQ